MYIVKNQTKRQNCLLYKRISWKDLPWYRIYLRVSMLKKQVFFASKKYDLLYVYKLQNYIINCNESKAFLVNKFFAQLISYKFNNKSLRYNTNNVNKFEIFRFVSLKKFNSSIINEYITEQIKQDLICLSIKPTWSARFAKQYSRSVYKTFMYTLKKIETDFLYHSLLIKNIIKKLKSYNYISKSVSNWLYKSKSLDYVNLYNSNYKSCFKSIEAMENLDFDFNINSLMGLTLKATLHDLHWYILTVVKQDYNCSNLEKSKKKFNLISKQELLEHYRNRFIFYGTIEHLINFKSYISFNTKKILLRKTFQLYRDIYYNLRKFILVNQVEQLNKLVNNCLYNLSRKSTAINALTFNNLLNNTVNSKLTNQFVIINNLDKLYKSFMLHSDLNYYLLYSC